MTVKKSENTKKKETSNEKITSSDKPTHSKKLTTKGKKVKSIKLSEAEFEEKVLELAKSGLTSERIGENLRQQGIHSKEHKIKISKILKEKNIYQDPELKNVQIKLERIQTHFEKNKQDKRAMREKDRIFSQVRKIKKYLGIPLK
ncbi:MAG: hypothetical protein ACE5ES_03075 [Candidatus Nanoarchaeia archaeon]